LQAQRSGLVMSRQPDGGLELAEQVEQEQDG
jgi:hypothetical protein